MTTKYKLKLSDIERNGGIAKLDRDGFTKQQVMQTVHREMRGATRDEKAKVVEKLYNRQEPC